MGKKLLVLLLIMVIGLLWPGRSQAMESGSLRSADAIFFGEAAGDLAGRSVAGAGDVNGDGYADFLVGANGSDAASSSAGAAYLLLGGPSGLGGRIGLAAPAIIRYTGQLTGDQAGIAVAGAGDVNGDGFDDFVVGASQYGPSAPSQGAVYLILGSAAPAGGSLDSAIRYLGQAAGDGAGGSVAGAGDVNGDGFDDFMVGAAGSDAAGVDAGAAYLILGNATPASGSLNTAIGYTGQAAGDWAGIRVGGEGDVNGDGYRDLLVGAIRNDAAGADAGAAYLILG